VASRREEFLADLEVIVVAGGERVTALQAVADLLKDHGGYRWIGLYDVDHSGGVVRIIVWSGSGPPEYPEFPITKGLTGAAIAERKSVNIGDVNRDTRYLTAFGTTRSEIIIPVFGQQGAVAGTIDVESERPNAFDAEEQALLEDCSRSIRRSWFVL